MLLRRFTKHLAFYLIALLFFPLSALAQEANLQLRPAILDVSGQPDQIVDTAITLTNSSDEPVAVSATARSLAQEDEVIDKDAINKYDASRWINLPVSDFIVPPKGSYEVKVQVKVPSDAVPGGHYALTVFRALSDSLSDKSGVTVHAEAGTVMLISVPGEAYENAVVQNTKNNNFVFGGEVVIDQEVLNLGNTHITPIIKTEIFDMSGEVVDSFTQPIQLLLPNTKRGVQTSWDSSGKIGYFNAKTSVSYGTPNKTLISEDGFLLFPSPLNTFLILVVFSYAIRRSHKYLFQKFKFYEKTLIKLKRLSKRLLYSDVRLKIEKK